MKKVFFYVTLIDMIYEVMLTLSPGQEDDDKLVKEKILYALEKTDIHIKLSDISALVCKKKSIDARHGQIKLHARFGVYVGETPATGFTPSWQKADSNKQVVIVGAGPAGLFAALTLLESGIQPIIIERGNETSLRKKDIAEISKSGAVNPDSNYCFGEGGAGAFSDGKLFSRSNKRGDISRILSIFHYHGADQSILSDAHPHIGTDKLPSVINAITNTIRSFGGIIHFNTCCTDFIFNDNRIDAVSTQNTLSREVGEIKASCVILACGHSADDIYRLVAKCSEASDNSDQALEAKTFAAGLRVEHPRKLIDYIQYHGSKSRNTLASAEYRFTAQIADRGVYTFCMCPGGFVVPSATGPDHIVINGMSASGRNSNWSNSAVVVEIRPEDIPSEFGSDILAGLNFRNSIEKEAALQSTQSAKSADSQNSMSQAAPAQRLIDFLEGKLSKSLPKSSYAPGIVSSRLDLWLPKHISHRLKEAFYEFDKKMKGFISADALLIAPETRTSTPVRILRNPATFESPALCGIYPAGEGSGYAGGIVSSAMDGEKVAQAIAEKCFSIST